MKPSEVAAYFGADSRDRWVKPVICLLGVDMSDDYRRKCRDVARLELISKVLGWCIWGVVLGLAAKILFPVQ